jgi:hypothetical protein
MISATQSVRRASGGVALAGAVALVTACGHSGTTGASGTSGAAGTPGTPGTPAQTITITAAPTSPAAGGATAAAPVPSPGGPAGAAPCPTRYLQARAGATQGAAGSIYQVIDFTNIGKATCTLYGYPGVSLAGGKPVAQIGLAAVENTAIARKLVTLAPHAMANALLQIVDAENYPPATCKLTPASYLKIYPPNQTTPIYLSYAAKACANPVQILTVGVVQPGPGGPS